MARPCSRWVGRPGARRRPGPRRLVRGAHDRRGAAAARRARRARRRPRGAAAPRGLPLADVPAPPIRVYGGADSGREDALLRARPQDLFAVSKLAGEAACLSLDRPDVRIVRMSTVYGGTFASLNFLCALLCEDAAERHPRPARRAHHGARLRPRRRRGGGAGAPPAHRREPHRQPGQRRGRRNDHLMTGLEPLPDCRVDLQGTRPVVAVPPVAVDRLRDEVGIAPRPLLPHLDAVVAELRRALASTSSPSACRRATRPGTWPRFWTPCAPRPGRTGS